MPPRGGKLADFKGACAFQSESTYYRIEHHNILIVSRWLCDVLSFVVIGFYLEFRLLLIFLVFPSATLASVLR